MSGAKSNLIITNLYFKIGDEVYSHLFKSGKGKVIKGKNNNDYKIHVREEDSGNIYSFTEEGRLNHYGGIVLSREPLVSIINKPCM